MSPEGQALHADDLTVATPARSSSTAAVLPYRTGSRPSRQVWARIDERMPR